MNFVDWTLDAGINRFWAGQGKYFRLLSGSGRIGVTARYADGSTRSFIMLTGLGCDLSSPRGEPFVGLDFSSPLAQTISFMASDLPTDDSRLSGDVMLSGAINTQIDGGSTRGLSTQAIGAGVAVQLLPANAARIKAAIWLPADCYLGVDNTVSAANGFPVTGGTRLIDENKGALWVFSVSAQGARILQDLK